MGQVNSCSFAVRQTWLVKVKTDSHVESWLTDYFSGLEVRDQGDGTAVITGELPDTAAVYGFILKLRDSGIDLIKLKVTKTVTNQA